MDTQNPVLHQLHQRKSVRVFTEEPVTQEMKHQIIQAALQAPTAGNQILYTILDIEDPVLKQQLSVSCDNQPFIASAPLVLIFLADCRRWYNAYRAAGTPARKPGVGDALLACADALIAAQNTVVAAQALGLGSCYIGDILENREQHVQLLQLDDYTLPACMVVYGHPAQAQLQRPKPLRFPAEYIVQKNRYTPMDEAALRAMFKAVHPEDTFDFEKYIDRFCQRKYMSDFSREMTRSAAEYLKNFTPFSEE